MITLNKKQKIATTYIDTPLIVSAHPGSGKTRIITKKVEYLITKGLKEEDILVLTFSRKSVSEIISRLDEDIGFLNSVNVYTFHSFGESILKEYGERIGIANDFEVLDDMQSFIFLKDHFFDFDINILRPISNPYKNIFDILKFLSKMQDENVSISEFKKFKGDEMQNELALLYKEFNDLKFREHKFQFNDLVYFAVVLLKKEQDILDRIQKKYKYILIDEFQDTNYVQNLLLKMISDGVHITVVGDRNQSIYKFRGAALNNFNTFKNEFKNTKEIDLDINYRSYQDVLDHSFKFMNMDPIKSIKGYNNGSIDILHFKNDEEEILHILDKIEQIHKNGGNYNDIAIILRTNSMISDFADCMNIRGIPFSETGNNNFLRSSIVKDLESIIRFFADKDDIAFTRLLSSGVFDISGEELYAFLNGRAFLKISYFEYLQSIKEEKKESNIINFDKFIKVLNLIEDILERDFKSANDLILYFLDVTDYYKYAESISKRDFIDKFLKITEKFKDLDIVSFSSILEYIDMISLSDLEDGEDYAGVVLSTIHGVKGLEFKYVFMPYLAEGFFPAIKNYKEFEIPDKLLKTKDNKEEKAIDEERRLFFVGMTRAKDYLCMSYSSFYREYKKERKISTFLEDTAKLSGFKIKDLKEDKIEKEEKHPFFFIPKDFKIKSYSFSQISMFARCPLQYYYSYILHIPQNPHFALTYGTIIHNSLKDFLSLSKDKWNVENMERVYSKTWENTQKRGFLGMKHEKLYLQKGLESLNKSFDVIIPKSEKFLLEKDIEYRFKNKYLIKGRIDRLDLFENNIADIIDYKTGSMKTDLSDYKFQLWLYSLAVSQTYRIDIKDLVLIFIDEYDKVDINMKDIKTVAMENKLIKVLSLMDEMEIKATPSFMCNFCDYKLLCYKR